MPPLQTEQKRSFAFLIRKYMVSAFVIFTFAAYAIHERLDNSEPVVALVTPTEIATEVSRATDLPQATPTATNIPPTLIALNPTATPTSVSSATSTPQSSPTAVPPTVTAMPPTATKIPPTATKIPPTAAVGGIYRDGTYTGISANAFFGQVQVKAIVQSGKISDVQFLNYPQDRRTSQRINNSAMPRLKQEAIQAQSAKVNIVSGATLTSEAFMQSLQSALNQAKA